MEKKPKNLTDWLNPTPQPAPPPSARPTPIRPTEADDFDALSVACPRCGRPPGVMCPSASDKSDAVCSSRVRAAIEKARRR